jgi:glycosyltransferase involved in cell wall biosynthesis
MGVLFMSKLYKTRGGRILALSDEQYKEFTNQYGEGAYILATQEDVKEYKMIVGDTRGLDVTKVYYPFWTDYKLHEGYGYTDYCFRNFTGFGSIVYQSQKQGADCMIMLHRADSLWNVYKQVPELHGKIGLFTMYETTLFPEPWLHGLNLADVVIVPNEQNKKSLLEQGIKNVEVCPLPYEPAQFPFKKRKKEGVFKFLMYNAGNHRKGWKETADAFIAEFGNNPNVQLTLKTIFPLEKKINGQLMPDPQFLPYFKYKNIKFVSEITDKKDLHKILHDHHCFVFPSKGEGWGYPPIEALSTGLPLIATNAHGHADFWTKGCYEVGFEMQPAEIASRPIEVQIGNKKAVIPSNQNSEQWRNSGDWWYPNHDDIRRQMRYVYENYEQCLIEAEQGSKEIQEKYSYKAVNPILSRIAKDLASGKYASTKKQINEPEKRNYKAIIGVSKVDKHLVHRPIEIFKKQDCEIYLLADYKSPITINNLKKEFGVKVIQHELNNDFASHRNFAINKMNDGDWIIMIDGDEVVDDKFIARLDQFLDHNPLTDAVALARINTYGDEFVIPPVDWDKPTGDQYPDYQVRVFKKTPHVKYEGLVHEQLTNYNVRSNTELRELTILHHKSYEKHQKSNDYYEVLESMRRG